MSSLDILGTYYQVEQRGQAPSLDSLPVARPQHSRKERLCCSVGEMLIRLGERVKGQVEADPSLNWPANRLPTT